MNLWNFKPQPYQIELMRRHEEARAKGQKLQFFKTAHIGRTYLKKITRLEAGK